MNLIATCPRHFEDETEEELKKILIEYGDKEPEITITEMPGILTVKTSLDPIDLVAKIREKILDEPWSVRYCLRIIPILGSCSTNLHELEDEIQKNLGVIKEEESYRITIEKRNSEISSKEIISQIAKSIPNKVSLENPDWIILIEIIGEKSGISVLRDSDILSVGKIKRSISE